MQDRELMTTFRDWALAHAPREVNQAAVAGELGMSRAGFSRALVTGRDPATVQRYLDRLADRGWPSARVVVETRIEEVTDG